MTYTEPKTIRELIDFAAAEYGTKPAYAEQEGEQTKYYSFIDVKNTVDGIAGHLINMGLTGRHIAVMGVNSFARTAAYYAVLCVGTVVPLPAEAPLSSIDFMLKASDAALILTDTETEYACPRLPLNPDGEAAAGFPVSKPEDLAQIVFTSGTTGTPKGVMLSQKNIMSIANCEFHPWAGIIGISVLPQYHAFESMCHLLVLLRNGRLLFMCPSLRRFAPMVASSGCDTLYLVPALAEALITRMRPYLDKATKLKRIVCGGASVPQSLVDAYAELGIDVMTGYGLSECSPLVSLNHRLLKNCCGVIGKYCRVRISDEGEIQVKGENVMSGYYKNEAATRAAFTEDGWLKTGDLGELDENNNLFLKGRIKNLIILSNGENVSPEELEALIVNSVKGAADALVSAKNDRLHALIYIPGGAGDEALSAAKDEIAKMNSGIESFKRINGVTLTAEPLPVNALGKKIRSL